MNTVNDGLWYVSAQGWRISGNKFMHNCDQYVWCGVSASALAGVKNSVVEDNEFGETQVVDGAVDGEDLDFEAGCEGVILPAQFVSDDSGGPPPCFTTARATTSRTPASPSLTTFFSTPR